MVSPTSYPGGDLADLDSTPAMQFPLPTSRRRSLLQASNSNEQLFGGGDDKTGSLSAGNNNGMTDLLQGKKFTFYPTQREDIAYTSWDYRVSCVDTLVDGGFVDDTGAAWTSINMWDDDSRAINPDHQFRFGGMEHGSIFVGSNGYLTVGGRRTTYSASISRHYQSAYKQISSAFTDLNPRLGGTIKWKDDTDSANNGSFTVSYNDISEYGRSANQYSYQVRVHQSGKIEMYYKKVPTTTRTVVVGISVGKFPRNFFNRDITALPDASVDCDSQPNLQVAIPITMRAPTQEFSTQFAPGSPSGRRLLAVDETLYNGELTGVLSGGDGKTPDFGAASATGNYFDLINSTLTFAPLAPVGGQNVLGYSVACVDTGISELPMGTQAATRIDLSDDAFVQISFTNNKKITFFGTEYDNVYIGSNGYLTFGRGDRMYYSHRYYHFRLPRISAMFTDLNPSRGGTIHWQQTAESFIVTFTHIKTYSGNYFFTFQIELNFDVKEAGSTDVTVQPFRISYTEATEGMYRRAIVGTSAGSLYRSTYYLNFAQWDLSTAASACPADSSNSGGFGVQSAGGKGGDSLASLSNGAPDFCPTNAFTVSFTSIEPPAVLAVNTTESEVPATVPSNGVSRSIPMVATLMMCIAALLLGMVV